MTRHLLTQPFQTLTATVTAAAGLALLLTAAPAVSQGYDTQTYGTPTYGTGTYEPAGYTTPGAQDGLEETQPADGTSYSYFRVVEGPATLTQVDSREDQAVETNQPVLAGDRLWVPPGSRLELVLSDGNLLRLGGGTEVVFEGLAGSPDTSGRETVLRLVTGHLQLVVLGDVVGDAPPRIETGSATLYTREEGVYRVTAEGSDHARLTVRDGSAELVTRRGSLLVRSGEQAWVDGGEWPRAGIQVAAEQDALEIWGERLVAEAELAAADPAGYESLSLRYAAAPLRDYGDWVEVGGTRAWRPRVEAGWRPYWHGSWSYTPSGWLWVSNEPWGWVPYHYGTWNLDPGYGWVWYPGDVFAPAWVYWYWGPSQVAWIPVGYYSHYYYDRYYAPRQRSFFGFHFGLYGYAGGHAGYYRNWVFCSIDRFGHHGRYGRGGYDRHGGHHGDFYRGDDFERRSRRDVVPRGVITTDTRGITRERLLRPVQLVDDLGRQPSNRRVATPRGELPDVTSFVAREPELSPELRTRLIAQTPDQGSRLAGTPLRPGTASRTATRATPHNPNPATRTLTPRSLERGSDRSGDRPSDRTPTAVRPSAPERPSSVRPSAPNRPTSVRPAAPAAPERRSTTLRPTGPASGDRAPTRVRPAAPAGPQRPSSVRPSSPQPQRPTSVRPSSPSRPSSVRPSAPERPSSVRPSAPSRPTSVRPATPAAPERRSTTLRPTGPASGDRAPTRVRPAAPAAPQRPSSVRPSSPRPQRPTSVRPSAPSRPSSIRPSTPNRPTSVRPATPSRPSSVRPTSPSSPSRRPSAVRPASPSSSPASRAAPSSPRGSRSPSASRPPVRRSSPSARSGDGRPASRSSAASSGGGGRSSSSPRSTARGSSGRGKGSSSGSGGRARRGGGGGGG